MFKESIAKLNEKAIPKLIGITVKQEFSERLRI